MNEIISKFLLNGDKFMPEWHLKQLGFTYSACGYLLNIVKEFKKDLLLLMKQHILIVKI